MVLARVLFEYTKDEENEMTLIEGEILERIEMIDEGWWSATGDNGNKQGLFPCTLSSWLPSYLCILAALI